MDTGQVRVQPRPGDLGQVGSSVMRTSTRKGIFRWRQQNDEKEENYKKDIKRENGRIRPYCHYFNYTDYDNSKINGQYMQLVEFVLSLETMKQTKKSMCTFRAFKSYCTQCLKTDERPENYTGFCCGNKLHLQPTSQLWKDRKYVNPSCIILDRPALRDLSEL